ncbi:hypothetical protein B0H10DRAFT_1943530 [Mycena sp. CBHHK59/15]|nr:hypothetical protein B0H10DRAFT_1943530 [Mycena sp. CBHHK59/15]
MWNVHHPLFFNIAQQDQLMGPPEPSQASGQLGGHVTVYAKLYVLEPTLPELIPSTPSLSYLLLLTEFPSGHEPSLGDRTIEMLSFMDGGPRPLCHRAVLSDTDDIKYSIGIISECGRQAVQSRWAGRHGQRGEWVDPDSGAVTLLSELKASTYTMTTAMSEHAYILGMHAAVATSPATSPHSSISTPLQTRPVLAAEPHQSCLEWFPREACPACSTPWNVLGAESFGGMHTRADSLPSFSPRLHALCWIALAESTNWQEAGDPATQHQISEQGTKLQATSDMTPPGPLPRDRPLPSDPHISHCCSADVLEPPSSSPSRAGQGLVCLSPVGFRKQA